MFIFNTIVYVIMKCENIAFSQIHKGLRMVKAKGKSKVLLDFAKKVRLRRYEMGLTQEELAERADFHVNYIGSIERGERNSSIESVVKLAKALKISPKDLLPE